MGRFCIPKEPNNRKIVLDDLNSFSSYLRRISSDLLLSWDIVSIALVLCIFLSYSYTVLNTYRCCITKLTWWGIVGSCISFGDFAWLFWLEAERVRIIFFFKLDKII